jgi:hypothetical protein
LSSFQVADGFAASDFDEELLPLGSSEQIAQRIER